MKGNRFPKPLKRQKRAVITPKAPTASRKAHRAAERASRRIRLTVAGLLLCTGAGVASYPFVTSHVSDITASQAQDAALDDYNQKKAQYQAVKAVAPAAPAAGDKKKEATKTPAYSMDNLPKVAEVNTGEEYGIVRVPRWGDEYEKVLIEGNGADDDANNALLDRLGVVHYQTTAQPGETGNFSIAGHRNGYGSVFTSINTLVKGDVIEIETLEGTFIYSVIEEGNTINPSDNYVLKSNPFDLGKKPTRKLLTMTTCGWWTDTTRVVVVAELTGFKAP